MLGSAALPARRAERGHTVTIAVVFPECEGLARLNHDASAPSSDAYVMVVLSRARHSVEARVIERNNKRHTTVVLVGSSRVGGV